MSHSVPCWEHVFSYCCNLMLCGVNITAPFAYIRWLMTVFPKTQPVLHLLATLVNVKQKPGTRSPLQLPNSTAHSKIKATTEIPQRLLRTVSKLFRSQNSNLSIKYENVHEFWLPRLSLFLSKQMPMFKFEGELVVNGGGEGSALWFYLAQF